MPSKAAQRDFLLPPSDSFSIQIICIIVLFPDTFYSYLSYKDDFFSAFYFEKTGQRKHWQLAERREALTNHLGNGKCGFDSLNSNFIFPWWTE